MSSPTTVALSSTVGIAIAVAIVGFAAFWSNPRRTVNGGFFALSLLVALWLICFDVVVQGGASGPFWFRMTSIMGALVVVPLWFIKEAIVSDGESPRSILPRGVWWVLACAAVGAIRTTEWFVGPGSGINVSRYLFFVGVAAMYALLCRQTVQEMRVQTGLKRLELQIVLLGGSAAALTVVLLFVVREVARVDWLIDLVPVVVLLFYSGTVIAITTSRVFNARQLLIVGRPSAHFERA